MADLSYQLSTNAQTHACAGGHLNPAVSLAATMSGHIDYIRGFCYISAQARCMSSTLIRFIVLCCSGHRCATRLRDAVSIAADSGRHFWSHSPGLAQP